MRIGRPVPVLPLVLSPEVRSELSLSLEVARIERDLADMAGEPVEESVSVQGLLESLVLLS